MPKDATVFDIGQYINMQFGRLTKIKLHKLLYFCQAWYLAKYGVPLFASDFYAWQYGPVVQDLHAALTGMDKVVVTVIPGSDIDNITLGQRQAIDAVIEKYGEFDKDYLVELSHSDAPWRDAYPDAVIPKDTIKEFYKTRIAECPIH